MNNKILTIKSTPASRLNYTNDSDEDGLLRLAPIFVDKKQCIARNLASSLDASLDEFQTS